MDFCGIWGVKETWRGWNICLRGTSGHVLTLCQQAGPLFPESRSPSRSLTSKRPPASVAREHSRTSVRPSVRPGRLQRRVSPQMHTCLPPPAGHVTEQLHPSCARAQALAAVHRRTQIKAEAPLQPQTHGRSNRPAGFICVNRSLPELCSQPALSSAVLVPASVLLSPV